MFKLDGWDSILWSHKCDGTRGGGYKDTQSSKYCCNSLGQALQGLICVHLQEDKRANLELAFNTAQKLFGVPKLLDVDDMLEGKPDELSVMTYVSYFRHELIMKSSDIPAPQKRCAYTYPPRICFPSTLPVAYLYPFPSEFVFSFASGEGLTVSYVGEKTSFLVSTKTQDGRECRKGGANVTAELVDTVNRKTIKVPDN